MKRLNWFSPLPPARSGISDYLWHVLPTLAERAELRFTVAYAIERCRAAAERLFRVAGANATYDASPLQARFRDLNVAVHHAMADLDGAAEQFGRVRLGLDPNSPVL